MIGWSSHVQVVKQTSQFQWKQSKLQRKRIKRESDTEDTKNISLTQFPVCQWTSKSVLFRLFQFWKYFGTENYLLLNSFSLLASGRPELARQLNWKCLASWYVQSARPTVTSIWSWAVTVHSLTLDLHSCTKLQSPDSQPNSHFPSLPCPVFSFPPLTYISLSSSLLVKQWVQTTWREISWANSKSQECFLEMYPTQNPCTCLLLLLLLLPDRPFHNLRASKSVDQRLHVACKLKNCESVGRLKEWN